MKESLKEYAFLILDKFVTLVKREKEIYYDYKSYN